LKGEIIKPIKNKMKNFNQYIIEKIKLSDDRFDANYTLFPKTKKELIKMIRSEVEKTGEWTCDLNHIDVSKIYDLSGLFSAGLSGNGLEMFRGDISGWDVSRAKNMMYMFYGSEFNGDISGWDVSNVESMYGMFLDAMHFNQPIGDWDIKNVRNMYKMFYNAEKFDQNLTKWNIQQNCSIQDMFTDCPIKDTNKPYGVK
jgi:hypothetical protein